MKKLLFVFMLSLLMVSMAWGQVNISAGATVTQDFSIETSATAALPAGWKADKNSTVRQVGSYSDAVTATERSDGNNMATNASNGIYNFGAGPGAGATDRAVGGLSSSSASKSVNLYVQLYNNGSSGITDFTISYNVEKYRNGSNSNGFSIQMYYSTNGSSWTTAGSDFLTSFSADANNNGYATAPGATVSVSNKTLSQALAASSSLYLAWNYSVTSGSTTSNAQALGVDDITVIANTGGTPTAATPTFIPNGGNFINNVDVTLSCETEDSTIYYTTNGTDPSDGSDEYTSPITLNATTTLKAIAYAAGYAPSIIASATFTKLEPATTTIPYDQDFSSGLTGVSTYDVAGTKPWSIYDSDNASCNGYGSTLEEHWLVLPGINFDAYSNERMRFNTIATFGSIDANNYLSLLYSNDYPGLGDPSTYTWTAIPFANGGIGGGETSSGVLDLSTISGNAFIAFKYYSSDNPTRWEIDDISIYLAVPVINVSASLTEFSYVFGSGPSAVQSFTVSGNDLTEDITINALFEYEISLLNDSGFSNTITLARSGTNVPETTIYVRLKSGLAIGLYNFKEINILSGLVEETVVCHGQVIDPSLTIETFANFPETSTSYNSGTFEGTDGTMWTYTKCAGSLSITGKSVTLGRNQTPSAELISDTITGGIGTLSFDYMQAFSNNVSLDVYVNETLVETVTSSSQQGVVLNSGPIVVNQPGNVVIRFYNPTGGQVVIDNVMWNSRYDIPDGEQTTIDGFTLTLTGGSANSVVGNLASFPAFNNGSFTPLQSIFLTMSGGGPWNFDIVTVAPWGAYCYLGIWHAVENSGGHIIFTIDPTKAFVVPIVLGDEDPTLPVELSTFTVSLNSFNNAVLNWVTQTETGVSGFYVYRNNSENLASAILVSNLIPATNSSEEHSYSFTDKELFSHGTYYYWLQVADIDGSESYHGPATLVYTGDNEPALPSIPTVTELRSIFPNPFNPNTNLSYSLAEEAEVSVKIYNARGQLVRTLNEGRKAVGHHSAAWDGKDDRGQNQSTGVYFFRMQAGKKVFNSKAVLMK